MNYKRVFISNSFVFITVVTKNRQKILIENIEHLRNSFKSAKEKYVFDIIAIVVNLDHFHMIIQPKNIEEYPKIIGSIKSSFTKQSDLNTNLNKNREADIWQRRYWEHTILNEEDLNKHIDYIHYNPYKHYQISPKDWVFSSFNKFVKEGFYDINWCNFEDKHNINSINYE